MSIKHLVRTLGPALVATLAVGAVMASAAMAGPEWRVEGTKLASGAKKTITFKNSGNTSLVTASDEIVCTSAVQGSGTSEILGGSVGTGKAKIEFKGCKVTKPFSCEVTDKTTKKFGIINVSVNVELGYETSAKTIPVLVFGTTSSTNKLFVELEFSGFCAFGAKKVEATGSTMANATGIAGVVCKLPSAGAEELEHSLKCEAGAQKDFFNAAGTKLSAGLLLGGEVAEQVGTGIVKLSPEELYSVV